MVAKGFALLALAVVCGCGESAGDIIDEFVEESGLAFEDCGAGTECGDAAACLTSAFETCAPARADVGGETHFVVPEDGRCILVFFSEGTDTSGATLEKHTCLSIGSTQASCVERASCTTTNRWHL